MNLAQNKDQWAEAMSDGKRIILINHFLNGNELPEWELLEALPPQEVENATLKTYLFKGQGKKENQLLKIDLVEAGNWKKSHDITASLLNEYMSLEIKDSRSGKVEIGDIGFTNIESPTYFLFSRGNITARVSNIGSEIVPVNEISGLLDHHFFQLPKDTKIEAYSRVIEFGLEVDKTNAGERIPIKLSLQSPFHKEAWIKLVCASGEFTIEKNQVFYTGSEKGPETIKLYLTNREGEVHSEAIEFNLE